MAPVSADVLGRKILKTLSALARNAFTTEPEEGPRPARPSRATSAKYRPVKVIGRGTYGHVWLCEERVSNGGAPSRVACKVVDRKRLCDLNAAGDLEREVEILKRLSTQRNEGIVQLIEAREGDSKTELVMEHCDGGDLFDRILSRGPVAEPEAKVLFAQLTEAVHFCHAHGIIHRDIKPENVLLTSSGSRAKLVDFGLATEVPRRGARLKDSAGTLYYAAPEVLQGSRGEGYDVAADVWSLGVVLFCMLTGSLPQKRRKERGKVDALWESFNKGSVRYDLVNWGSVSRPAQELVQGMLQTDPEQRLSLEDVKRQEWLVEGAERAGPSQGPPVEDARGPAKSCHHVMLAQNLLCEDNSSSSGGSTPIFDASTNTTPESGRCSPHRKLLRFSLSLG